MAKQKRHNKRISQKKSVGKMKGGLLETDRQILTGLGFADDQINYIFTNNPNMMIEFFQNSINPPPNNPFYTEAQTPNQIMESLREINEDNNLEGSTTTGEIVPDDSLNNTSMDISMTSNDLNTNELDTLGGKRKSKKRTTNKKKKKTRKTRKTRK